MANDVAWVDVLPSMRQFMPSLDRAIQQGMPTAGRQAGQSFGEGFQRTAADAVEKVSATLTAARNKEADAAGKLRVAEEKLNELRASGRATTSQLVAAEERLAAAQRTHADRMEATESATRRLTQAQERLSSGSREVADSLQQVERSAGIAERGMDKVKGSVGGLVAGMGAAGAVVGAFWSNLSNEAGSDRLAASLGLTATRAAEAGQITARIYRGAWGESMEEVQGAVGSVMSSIRGMSDASSADIERISIKALEFSKVFEVDMARAVSVAGTMISAGLAPNADAAFDLLVASSQKVPAALREDLLDATEEYGQFFMGLGFTGEQTMNALVAASAKGTFGIDKMGDAIKEFTIRSTDMSTTSVAAYDTLGLSAEDMTNKILGGGEGARQATDEIIRGLLGIEDPATRANTAIALFGTPLEDLNVTEIPSFLEGMLGMSGGMGEVQGAADRMSATLNDNFATRFEGWKRQATGFAQDGLLAIANGFTTGEATSQGWVGVMERVGSTVKTVFTEISGSVTAFAAAWRYNDGEVTSSGLPGFFERVGYWARQTFDFLSVTAIPVIQSVGGFLLDHEEILLAVVGAYAAYRLAMIASTAVTAAQGAAQFITTASTYGLSYALTAGGTAARVYAAGQWIANASLLGFPLVWVVAAFAAVAAGLYMLWTHSETFRNIVTAVWDAVQAGISWAWSSVIQPIFGFFVSYWTAVGNAVVWGWTNLIQPAWNAVSSAASWLWSSVLQPIFGFIGTAWRALGDGIAWVWSNILKPTWDVLSAVANALYQFLAFVIFAPILVAWELLSMGIRWAWENVIQPAWRAVEAGASWLWTNVLSPIFGWIGAAWRALADGVQWAWSNIISPAWNAVSTAASWLWNTALSPIFSAIGTGWRAMTDGIRWVYDNIMSPAFEAVKSGVQWVGDKFSAVVGWIGEIWNGLKRLLAVPINFMIGTVWNNGIRKAWNLVADLLPGVDPIGELPLIPENADGGQINYANGGRVRGPWKGPRADNILAMVDNRTPIRVNPREWIHPVDAVDSYGSRFMADVQTKRFPTGLVDAYYSGHLETFATGGQLFAEIRKEFPRAKSNSQYRPGDPGYHGRGQAVDLGEEGFSGGTGRPYLAAMKRWLVDNYGRSSEIIYNGSGNDRPNIKNGSNFAYSAAVQAQHRNHVHWAQGPGLAEARNSGAAGLGNWFEDRGSDVVNVVQDLLAKVGEVFTAPARAIVNAIPFDAPPRFMGIPKRWGNSVIDKAAAFFDTRARESSEEAYVGGDTVTNTATGPNADIVKSVFASRGWGDGPQWAAADWIIQHESGWNPRAQNPVSTASGLFQHIDGTWRSYRPREAAGYAKMRLAPVNLQGIAGMNYIAGRYGTPTAAKSFWQRNNHYALGGQVPTLFDTGGNWEDGVLGLNLTGQTERVMAPDQDDYFRRFVDATSSTGDDRSGGDRMLAKEITVVARNEDEGRHIVDDLWHKVQVADRGGVWAYEED